MRLQVHECSYSTTWDTRLAAAAALGYLAEAFPHHTPATLRAAAAAAAGGGGPCDSAGPSGSGGHEEQQPCFQAFNLQQVLNQGTPLLSSGGQVRRWALAGLAGRMSGSAVAMQRLPSCCFMQEWALALQLHT